MATLERAIGPFAATLLVVGGIIGSGIFLTTGVMAESLPSASLLILVWVVGCLFAVFGALTYAEMAAMFPRSGGVYVFLREAFGTLPGLWLGHAARRLGGIAAVAVGSPITSAISSRHCRPSARRKCLTSRRFASRQANRGRLRHRAARRHQLPGRDPAARRTCYAPVAGSRSCHSSRSWRRR
jgi:hypothetical protein